MAKRNQNNTNTNINETNSNSKSEEIKMENTVLNFVASDALENKLKALIVTPKDNNGMFFKVDLFDAVSAINATRDFLAGYTAKSGYMIHVTSPEHTKYDGFKSIYVGGNKVKDAMISGYKEMIVMNGEDRVYVTLPNPEKIDLIPEWCKVKMNTQFSGVAIACKNEWHKKNTTMKHEYLEKLLNGTKLVIFVEPTLVAGKVFSYAETAAQALKAEVYNEDGTFKTSKEIMQPKFERSASYQTEAKLDNQTERLVKLAPVMNIPIIRVLKVNNVETEVQDVPVTDYIILDKSGFIRGPLNGRNNLDFQNRLLTIATNGWSLKTK